MTLEKIHIKNRGTLVDFEAKFGPITVIYGPNASGKSLLSNALRAIERKKWSGPGEAEVTIDGSTLRSADFANSEASDRVRVFNADFLRDDVMTDEGAEAIVLGSNVQEQRMEINRLSDQVSNLGSRIDQLTEDLKRHEESMGEKHQAAGELVRTVLRTVPKVKGANPRWPSYNRRDARDCYERMMQDNSAPRHYKASDELETLAEAIRQRPSNLLNQVRLDDPRIRDLHKRATALLQKIPNSGSLPEATNDPGRRDWLLKGHGYASSHGHCAYCLQVVPPDRVETLDSYFSRDMTKLLSGIEDLILGIDRQAQLLQQHSPPSVDEVRSDLQGNYRYIRERWCKNVGTAISALATIKSRLMSKKESPNLLVEVGVELPDWDSEATNEVNQAVKAHNESVDDLLKFCYEYELGAIANRFDEWKGVEDQIADLKSQITANNKHIAEQKVKLDELKHLADTRLIAADELTDMVRNFLGHDEIGFELNADDRSYQLTRNGEPANNFSEGERTALALMYFLKRLEDDSFDKRNGTIVFDDPITSFDEDNLFRAVAFIIDRTGVTAQGSRDKPKSFVVLTHHFGLLERLWWEFKNQRSGREGKPPRARFFQMRCTFNDSHRESKLEEIQQAVITEYQVAFDEVSSIAQGNTKINNPENSIRKCMEGFLIRVTPDYELDGALKTMQRLAGEMNVDNPSSEQLRLLVNVANAGSHAGATIRHATLENGWHRLKQASKTLLDLMRVLGQEHHRGMERLRSKRT